MTSATCTQHGLLEKRVELKPQDDQCCIIVDGKEDAIHLRQELVRRRIPCTFPAPAWQRSKYLFHAKGASRDELERLIDQLETQVTNSTIA